jgi:hypothetical protein
MLHVTPFSWSVKRHAMWHGNSWPFLSASLPHSWPTDCCTEPFSAIRKTSYQYRQLQNITPRETVYLEWARTGNFRCSTCLLPGWKTLHYTTACALATELLLKTMECTNLVLRQTAMSVVKYVEKLIWEMERRPPLYLKKNQKNTVTEIWSKNCGTKFASQSTRTGKSFQQFLKSSDNL